MNRVNVENCIKTLADVGECAREGKLNELYFSLQIKTSFTNTNLYGRVQGDPFKKRTINLSIRYWHMMHGWI